MYIVLFLEWKASFSIFHVLKFQLINKIIIATWQFGVKYNYWWNLINIDSLLFTNDDDDDDDDNAIKNLVFDRV